MGDEELQPEGAADVPEAGDAQDGALRQDISNEIVRL